MTNQQAGRRLVFTAPGQAALEPFDLPEPGPHQALVRATRTLVSAGTEVKTFLGTAPGRRHSPFPAYPGYSFVGVVEQVGEQVAVRPGDRVLLQKGHASHALVDLSANRPPGPSGHRGPEYIQVLPDGLTDEQASFGVLGSVAMHGVRKAAIALDDSAAVMGQGVVGQLVLQLARLAGARPVIAIDLVEERLAAARVSGADVTIDATQENVITACERHTAGRGVDVSFECTSTPRTFPALLRVAAVGGRIVIVGSLPGTVEISLFDEIQIKELAIIGAFQPRAPLMPHHTFSWTQRRNRLSFLELVAAERVQVDHLVTHVAPAAEAPALYGTMAQNPSGWLGVILAWDQ